VANNRQQDLVNDPVEIALQRVEDQTEDVLERLAPRESRLSPTTQWLHRIGLRVKDLTDNG